MYYYDLTGATKTERFTFLEDRCEKLSNVSYVNFGLSLFILLGILISYLPQHVRIVLRRSSLGLSPYFVLLGTTSGTCAFANILALPDSRADIACCHVVHGFACFAGLLGIAQVTVQWSCFCVILLLFLVYFPRATPSLTHPEEDQAPRYTTALAVVAMCVLHAIVTAIVTIYFVLARPDHLQGWANFLGILATVLAAIQYFPQIYTTFKLRTVASLSIPMMCIQTPGSFVWAASLAARYGPAGWSAWGIYVITGTLQGTLLCMGIYFEIHNMQLRKKQQALQVAAEETSEETPLLRSEN